MVKFLVFICITSSAVLADETTTTTKSDRNHKTIVIAPGSQDSSSRAGEVQVVSDITSIKGSIQSTPQAAMRVWDEKCLDWKNELKRNNKSNLLVSECGSAELKETMLQGEKGYWYESKDAKYKIKVTSSGR